MDGGSKLTFKKGAGKQGKIGIYSGKMSVEQFVALNLKGDRCTVLFARAVIKTLTPDNKVAGADVMRATARKLQVAVGGWLASQGKSKTKPKKKK